MILRMRLLVISDVHANLTALEAVLGDAPEYEAVWCLGDLAGYGPDPNACIERMRSLPGLICLIGNHDMAAIGSIPLSRFNEDARLAAAWTKQVLDDESAEFLRSLPTHVAVDKFTLAHGSPRHPDWEYVLDESTADINFGAFETDYCLVGHSHMPLIFHRPGNDGRTSLRTVVCDAPVSLEPRMILNPGSVGQPRDLDPRAAYAILDLDTLTWEARRVSYDIVQIQERMLAAGLPERLALRLLAGW